MNFIKSVLFTLCIFGFNAINLNAQSYNLVIFSEDGDPFYAIVNGVRQNDKPETNIKVTGLTAEALSLRVEFENAALPKLKQNMMGENGFEHTIKIRRNKKMELKMQYFGKVALEEAPKSSASTVAYHTSENPVGSSSSSSSDQVNYNTSTTITENGQTTTSTNGPGSENISINLNIGEAGMNMNVGGMNATQTSMQTTSSSTVTTTTRTSGSMNSAGSVNETSASAASTKSNAGCNVAMTSGSFESMKKSVESKPFADTKMSTAKLATKNSCLSVVQVKSICALFSMDDDKLTYAKFAYDYCVDKANYYKVSEAFSFDNTTEEFNHFLEAK
ncbi:MAG: DUF4476 domain-containing protein [Sphingobacteriaceae bacterium]|nr:DUF4476 domain-containing protein [Sphingobacteriaceae bacterium]